MRFSNSRLNSGSSDVGAAAPKYVIDADFQAEDATSQPVTITITDVTTAGGHNPQDARLLHVIFEASDKNYHQEVKDSIAGDFQSFYTAIQAADAAGQNPMNLPAIDPAGIPWWEPLQAYLQALNVMHRDTFGPEKTPTCNPLGLSLDKDGKILSAGMAFLKHREDDGHDH